MSEKADARSESKPASRRALERIDHPQKPELVFGLVAAIGTPLDRFVSLLHRALTARDYHPETQHLSDFLEAGAAAYTGEEYTGSANYVRYMRLMSQGDELRTRTGAADILALYAAGSIGAIRPSKIDHDQKRPRPMPMAGTAHILRQLKNPEEVYRLRSIYGEAFILIGLYCPRSLRKEHLLDKGISPHEIEQLITRDEEENSSFGQKLTETFHLADMFLEVRGAGGEKLGASSLDLELDRYLDLLFGSKVVTPSRAEFAMFVAFAASLRSSSLGRQVGASIISLDGELVSSGTNEVPAFGGGQYWGESNNEARDHERGGDPSDQKKLEMVTEILSKLDLDYDRLEVEERQSRVLAAMEKLKGTQLLNLTEFMRPVHAEMEAISAAARTGTSVRSATLYSTTFPCHNCAKHIIAAGLRRVYFIEPYSKSRALEMHDDAITLDETEQDKVQFLPFVGVAPRKYIELFSRTSREGRKLKAKDTGGAPRTIGFRSGAVPYSYIEREAIAADAISLLRKEKPDAFADEQRGAAEPADHLGENGARGIDPPIMDPRRGIRSGFDGAGEAS